MNIMLTTIIPDLYSSLNTFTDIVDCIKVKESSEWTKFDDFVTPYFNVTSSFKERTVIFENLNLMAVTCTLILWAYKYLMKDFKLFIGRNG